MEYKSLDADDDVLDSEDEEIEENAVKFTIIDKINELLQISNEEYQDKKVQEVVQKSEAEIQRMMKMFFMHMKVRGNLHDRKEDYFKG